MTQFSAKIASSLDGLRVLEREFLDDPDYPRRADVVVNAGHIIEKLTAERDALFDVLCEAALRCSASKDMRDKMYAAIEKAREVQQ